MTLALAAAALSLGIAYSVHVASKSLVTAYRAKLEVAKLAADYSKSKVDELSKEVENLHGRVDAVYSRTMR